MANVTPPFAPDSIPPDRADAVRNWRGGLVEQVRLRAVDEINALEAPDDLAAFHESLLRCLTEDEAERPPSWHASPSTDGWPRVMMQLTLLCQEESIPFPTSAKRGQPAEPEPRRSEGGDWRTRVRRELELRGHPDPDEAIEALEDLSEGEGG